MAHSRSVVLLVGGDLCRHVAQQLDSEDWSTWGLRRHPVADPRIRWIQADLGSPKSLQGLPQDISHVLYAPAPDRRDAASYQTVYPVGIEHLLDALRNASQLRRFVLVGSTVVWPACTLENAMEWVDETTPTLADNFRCEAILHAERILFERLPNRGIALRLGGLYGPGRTRLLDGLRAGRIVAPDGAGHWSNRMHIEDAASACVHLLNLAGAGHCYIGTDGHPTGTAAFYDQLADLLAVPRPARRALPPTGKRLSNARLVASGWAPSWPNVFAAYRAMLDVQASRSGR